MSWLRNVKRWVRPAVESGLALTGPHRWPLPGPRLVVLTYHRVLPRDHPEWSVEQPGMMVTPESLALHLDVVRKYFEPVALEHWVERLRAGRSLPRRACAITFDDGWQDNYRYAWPVLRDAGIPATIFLVTDLVGTESSFWPNRLARLLRRWPSPSAADQLTADAGRVIASLGLPVSELGEALSIDDIDRAIEAAKKLPDAELLAALDRLEEQLAQAAPRSRDLLDWNEVRAMHASGLIRFGSHTCTHTRLRPGLDPAVLEREISQSRVTLEAELGAPAPLFCYPNGDCSSAALRRVAECYEGAVSTESGWNGSKSDPYLLRRIGLHEDVSARAAAFEARLSGLL